MARGSAGFQGVTSRFLDRVINNNNNNNMKRIRDGEFLIRSDVTKTKEGFGDKKAVGDVGLELKVELCRATLEAEEP